MVLIRLLKFLNLPMAVPTGLPRLVLLPIQHLEVLLPMDKPGTICRYVSILPILTSVLSVVLIARAPLMEAILGNVSLRGWVFLGNMYMPISMTSNGGMEAINSSLPVMEEFITLPIKERRYAIAILVFALSNFIQ